MRQLELGSSWGGRRKGAGRKRIGSRAAVPHRKRAFVEENCPLHVTIRVVPAIRQLRTQVAYRAIRQATSRVTRCSIIHMSIQHDHIHLVIEARDRQSLTRGMQSFQVSAARRLNSALSRHGRVFADRYHVRILRTPREVRNVIAYVLNNWRKHDEARGMLPVDPYSRGFSFDGWRDPNGAYDAPTGYEPLEVRRPRSWLLRIGWKRAGSIDALRAPGRH